MGSDYVEVIDWRTQKTVKRIKTGNGAHNFRSLGDKRHLFVSNRVQNSINIIDQVTLENVGMITVPGGPDCMELTERRQDAVGHAALDQEGRRDRRRQPQGHQDDPGRPLAARRVLRQLRAADVMPPPP
jgi:hypothetical protein